MTDKSIQEDFYSSIKDNDEIDLGNIFRVLLMQSKLIILIVFAVFVMSYVNYSLATKRYLIQSLLQYESFNQNIFNPSKIFNTGNRKGPVQYALSQVDVESRLGNRYMALQKNDHAFYIPPLNSDLYEYSMQTGNIISMHQEFQETASKNMDMYNTAPDIFQNATRTNLKKANI